MAETKAQLKRDLAAAMRAKDEAAKTTIRGMLAAIGHEEVAGDEARELTDSEELAILGREQRRRLDSAQTYADAGRPELAAAETAEAELIAGYLPAPLSDTELDDLVTKAIDAAAAGGQAPTMRDMGKIIKQVNQAADGRASGAAVAAKVKQALAN